jgi:hypothetical protein
MAMLRCPHCKLPLSRTESTGSTCPVCGASLAEPAPQADAEQPPQAEPTESPPTEALRPTAPEPADLLRLVLAGAALLVVLTAGLCLYYLAGMGTFDGLFGRSTLPQPAGRRPAAPRPAPATQMAAAPVGPTQPASPAAAKARPPAARPAPPEQPATRQVAAVPEAPAQPATRPAPPAPREMPALADLAPGQPLRLNDPNGLYVLDPLRDGASVQVTGKVKTLLVTDVIAATLDATGLDVEEILFAGEINGRATVKLAGKAGTLTLRGVNGQANLDATALEARRIVFDGEINGQCTVRVSAPRGTVVFGRAEGEGSINGEAKLTIRAREVLFGGPINGATKIDVTLSKGGRLKFARIDGSSRLHYRRADPGDPDPRVEAGLVRAAAEVKEIR